MEVAMETRRLLSEVAYVACVSNQPAQAKRILAGLEAISPGGREVVVGKALVDMTEGNADAAAARLRPLADGGDSLGTAFLGLALKLAGRASECDDVLSRMPDGDADAEKLAAALRQAAV